MAEPFTGAWTDFFVALAGAAAALAGLVMVAISVNLTEILAARALPARAAAAIGSLVFVVVAAGAGLIPGQPPPILGLELLLALGAAGALHAVSVRRTIAQHEPGTRPGVRIAVSVLQFLPVLVGAVALALSLPEAALYWVAAGLLLTLVGSMLDAWVLMVEIRR